MNNNLFTAIRDLAKSGFGVDDILVKLKLDRTRTTRDLVRQTAFGPRPISNTADTVVRIK